MNRIDEYPLALDDFIHWVGSKDKDEIIGRSQILDYCPVANAIKDRTKIANIRVRGDITFINYDILYSPKWVRKFISEIDKLGFQKLVTSRQALEVLSQIIEEKYEEN